ncbi:MAG: polysaccharide biosynthesis protein [Defluviitaleaceae bacterium]|nr:polysaccharide biosynthesis protein [Defluviitaleaceae bacterium]
MRERQSQSHFLMQATILATAGLLARVMGFLYRIPMQNILGDAGTSVYGQAYSLYMFFFVMSSAGMPAAISKMVSHRIAMKQPKNALKVLNVALLVTGSLGFFGMFAMFFGANALAALLSSQHVFYSLQVLAPTVFIVSIMSVYRGYFQGLGNSLPTAVSQLVEQILNAVFSVILVFILIDEGIAIAAAGGTAASGIGAVFGLFFMVFVYNIDRRRRSKTIRKYRRTEKPEPAHKIAIELVSTAFPIVAGTAIFSITNIIDVYMVVNILVDIGFSYMESQELFGQLIGKYVVITTLPVAIATAIAMALIPSITKSVTLGDLHDTHNKINMALRFTMLICAPAAMGVGVMAYQILLFLFPHHPEGGILLQVGAVSILFLAINQVATGILYGFNMLKVPLIAALFGATVKILLNFLLIPIPHINVTGAVISTTVCYFIASSINLATAYKVAKSKMDIMGIFVKPILAATIMGLMCYVIYNTVFLAISSNAISLFIAILASIVTYFGIMVILGGLTKAELRYLPMGGKIIRVLERNGF